MGYTHYLETDGQLTKEQARICGEACLDFLDKVPAFVLEALLEKPETLRKEDMPGLAAMNEAVLKRDRAAALEAMDRFWNGGFAVQPVFTETFSIAPEEGKFMFCKTGGPSVPADPLVVCLHLAAQEALRDGRKYPLRFSSDGDRDCMKFGMDLWRRCMHRKAPGMPFVRKPDPEEEREAPQAPSEPSVLAGDAVQDGIEAAMCIWEDIQGRIGEGGAFRECREEIGLAELRGRMREPELLEACCEGWKKAEEAMPGAAFDKEYVPLFVDACIDAESASLRKDWAERLDEALSAAEAPHP